MGKIKSQKYRFIVSTTMALIISLLFLITVISTVDVFKLTGEEKAGCVLDIRRDLTFEHPLILNPNTNDFIYPGSNGKINLNTGDKILLACTGSKNYITTGKNEPEKNVECVSGNVFKSKSDNAPTAFVNFKCNDYPESIGRKTGKKCSGKYTETEVGFKVSTGFVTIMNTCLDETRRDTLYSTFTLIGTINHQQIKVPRPDGFEEGDFYPGLYPTPSALYSKKSQLNAVSKLLKSNDLANKYIKLNDDYFFIARGHMTAKADYIYGSQQRATFYYVNVAPQWQIFNEENWNVLEQDVRTFVGSRKQDYVIYTGVWGNSMLPDVQNKQTQLFLFIDRNGKHQLTVPEVYWKIIYDPRTKTAAAFIGHNNPYEMDVSQRPICPNVCNKLPINLNWSPNNFTVGYSYCCDYKDLKKVVTYLPDINVGGLLV